MTDTPHPQPTRHYDYIVLGAGPAGLQLGYYLAEAGRNYLILEAGETPGTFFKTYPRHRKLISINKVYTGYDDTEINLRWDWNSLMSDSDDMLFKHFSKEYFPAAETYVEYLGAFATRFGLNVEYGVRVARIGRAGDFELTDDQGRRYTCRRLVVATGVSQPYVPPIPGVELAEKYTEVSVDPADFINQRVLVIGKGNSGFETADNLIPTAALIHIASPTPLSLAWESKFVGHLRAVNNNFLDTYQLKSQNAMLDATIERIERRGTQLAVTFKYTHADDEVEEIVYDRVILCTGFRFDASIFDEACRPALTINDRFPAQTSAWASTNVPDLYFAGTLTQMRDFKKKQSGFIHGFRYNVRALHRILEQKYHGADWPKRTYRAAPEELMAALIGRVNRTSGLWQQTGLLGDVLALADDGETAEYYEEVPVDYVHDGSFGVRGHYYIMTLEFGQEIINNSPDPLAISRVHKDDVEKARLSTGIHPILRHYYDGRLLAEHHVIEDLASEWLEDVHTGPLLKFLEADLPLANAAMAG